MNIVIVGCGRVGAELAYRLYSKGHQVAIIDPVSVSFQNLNPDFRGRTIEGDALNQDVLLRAGIVEADSFAAVTNSDTLNAVVAHIARSVYEIQNVVVRNYDPRWRTMLESFGLQIVSSSSWGAQRVEELLYHADFRTVFSAGNGEVEIYEFILPGMWHDRSINDLFIHEGCAPVAITRAGKALLAKADTPLQHGDVLLVSATQEGIKEFRQRIYATEEA